MSLAEKIDNVHEQLIEEEGLKVVDLPTPIKRRIKGWNLLFGKLKKSPDDEKLFRSIQRKSVEIADDIQNYIEQDYDDEDSNPTPKKETKEETKEDKKEEKKEEKKEPSNSEPKKETNNAEPKKQSNKGFGNLVMEKKIKSKLSNGRIRVSELKQIIGKEPDYPEQKVHSITLRKVFMSSDYRIV